jgi:hypothetical protein
MTGQAGLPITDSDFDLALDQMLKNDSNFRVLWNNFPESTRQQVREATLKRTNTFGVGNEVMGYMEENGLLKGYGKRG